VSKFYDYLTVSGAANAEVTSTFLTSTEEEPKRINKLYIYEATATRQNDAIVRVYIERERIAEIPIGLFLDHAATPTYPNAAGEVEIDVELPIGQSLIVGHVSGATPSNITFVAEYEIVG